MRSPAPTVRVSAEGNALAPVASSVSDANSVRFCWIATRTPSSEAFAGESVTGASIEIVPP